MTPLAPGDHGSPRIVVFGYHDMGVACLEELLGLGARVVAVVTHRDASDEPAWFDSVAEQAAAHRLPVFAPANPNGSDFVEALRGLGPELIFSFYYRRLLSPALLSLPRLGAVNLHGSLLPKYRGRAPLNWVLVRGETVTGVTLHHMDEQADHGDIIAQRAVPILIEDTALTLWRKLVAAGRTLLAETYPLIAAGRAPRIPQEYAAASTFGRRRPADGRIDWSRPAREIYNLIRAVTHPFPGAFTHLEGRQVFVWAARPPAGRPGRESPGTILGIGEGGALDVATGEGAVEILRLQPGGDAEMDGAAFLARFGPAPLRFGRAFGE